MTVAASPAVDALPGTRPATASDTWRRWRTPAIVVAVILLGGIVIALLTPVTAARNSYLDPASTGPAGTRALADILAERGTTVIRVTTPAAALAAAAHGATMLLVTSPRLLSGAQVTELAAARADLVLVQPDQRVLTALAPGVIAGGSLPVAAEQPGCRLAAAVLAGSADLGGTGLRPQAGAAGIGCYWAARLATLVLLTRGSRHVTILGSGAPLENLYLARLGNAALALNLLGSRPRIAWLVPQPRAALAGTGAGRTSLWGLIPLGTYLVAIELGVAVLLTALWRARRLGPLVTEPLPVIVRASETVEGHGRLYQARRARGQAAAALRDATIGRLATASGLPSGSDGTAVAEALASRYGLSASQVRLLLSGPVPHSDAALIALAEDLDVLEREVRAR